MLTGWKTKLAGIAGMLGALAALINDIAAPTFSLTSIECDIAALLASLTVFGLASKFQRIIDLLGKK